MKNNSIDFFSHFSEVYGSRWEALLNSLQSDDLDKVARCCRVESIDFLWKLSEKYTSKAQLEIRDQAGLKKFYIMDQASIIPPLLLNVFKGDNVLDMCAAPGGKTLLLAEALQGSGLLWANEISKARRVKLKNVIKEYCPSNWRENIFIKGKNGIRYGMMHPGFFDKILVDAPCSGEKYLINDKKELQKWSLKRTKRLAKQQYALLCSAMLSLKVGGRIVYSTCSISPEENDKVISRFLDKKGKNVELISPDFTEIPILPEKTTNGYIYLPDKSKIGPMYMSVMEKKCH
ncbi:MAG: RsmB/NOP family class I SAM-dependent RNA methyltransferase [Bacteriovoracia bacterium]